MLIFVEQHRKRSLFKSSAGRERTSVLFSQLSAMELGQSVESHYSEFLHKFMEFSEDKQKQLKAGHKKEPED